MERSLEPAQVIQRAMAGTRCSPTAIQVSVKPADVYIPNSASLNGSSCPIDIRLRSQFSDRPNSQFCVRFVDSNQWSDEVSPVLFKERFDALP